LYLVSTLIFSNLQEIEENNERILIFEDNEEQGILNEKKIESQTESISAMLSRAFARVLVTESEEIWASAKFRVRVHTPFFPSL